MLNINKKLDGEKLVVVLEGRLDTTTSPNLESESRSWYLILRIWLTSLQRDFVCCSLPRRS